ncbi:MAG: hypothetical protein HRU78_00825 [Gammaproteobacteria bacterium]|nr:MAG: hypothetical protein HRU78_00825 [Gammaproteobacteria bacterium]
MNRLTNGATGRVLRDFGRKSSVIAAGTLATGALLVDGFYNWAVIFKAAYDATSFNESHGKNCK